MLEDLALGYHSQLNLARGSMPDSSSIHRVMLEYLGCSVLERFAA